MSTQYEMIHMKEDDDCRVNENKEKKKKMNDQLLHRKIF